MLGREPRRVRRDRLAGDAPAHRRGARDSCTSTSTRRRRSSRTRSPCSSSSSIARAIEVDAQVLILDEPTSSLDAREVDELFEVVERVRASGVAVLFVTHFLDQVYRIADRITVLRNGRLVGEYLDRRAPHASSWCRR